MYEKKEAIEKKMQNLLSECSNELGFDSSKGVKLDNTDLNGYCFKLTLKDEKFLRDTKKFQIICANKGGVRFTSDKLLKLNESYSQIKELYEKNQVNVVQELLDIACKQAIY